jgi:hypothetical protein
MTAKDWHRRGMLFLERQGAASRREQHLGKCVAYCMRRALKALKSGETMPDRTRIPND